MNPVDELTALAHAQQALIDELQVDKARRHVEWAQAQHELVVAKQDYLRILNPRWDFIDGKLTRDPKWTAPSEAKRQAHQRAIAERRDEVTACSAAEAAVDTALAEACARLREMRAAWPAALGPFPVPETGPPDTDE
ncbi:hypothetical protein [Mycobacterium sp. E3247]|uniref:hypothetical protein n=1 Tax=Mycobacterium sp. E3247 TaxID=1856864 RepID=UPI000800F4F8|nr:hypothetical protein [Mycobacterium sp. E3247]OBH21442.1 hypothetical protein A9X04_05295 [Mycobacterium sp. E3247]